MNFCQKKFHKYFIVPSDMYYRGFIKEVENNKIYMR